MWPRASKPDHIDNVHLENTLGNYDQNAFIHYLLGVFQDSEAVWNVIKEYRIGTVLNTFGAYTCFPYIDRAGHFRRGKLIRYDLVSGKRLHGNFDTSSIVKILRLKENFVYDRTFFGEHLLDGHPELPITIVESEKTAIVAAICEADRPKAIWLAAGSLTWLSADRILRLGRDRTVVLYPDSDIRGRCYTKWGQIALEATKLGLTVMISSLLEKVTTQVEKAAGYDLGDYLLESRRELRDKY